MKALVVLTCMSAMAARASTARTEAQRDSPDVGRRAGPAQSLPDAPHLPQEPAGASHQTDGAPTRDLPLIEVPATSSAGSWLAVVFSGDGGWADIDRELSKTLASRGIAVVGFNSLRYFWSPRTPQGTAADLDRLLRYYLSTWHKERVILIGYSHGADVLPFLASRLPADLRAHVGRVAFLGAGHYATFEFHLSDWLRTSRAIGLPTAPEILKLGWTQVLCLYGERERDTVCPALSAHAAQVIRLPGGHHFNGNYRALADYVVAGLPE